MNLAEVVAVHAAGSYISLDHRPTPYLLRKSLESVAEKLKPYRIHDHRTVNAHETARKAALFHPSVQAWESFVTDGKKQKRSYKCELSTIRWLHQLISTYKKRLLFFSTNLHETGLWG